MWLRMQIEKGHLRIKQAATLWNDRCRILVLRNAFILHFTKDIFTLHIFTVLRLILSSNIFPISFFRYFQESEKQSCLRNASNVRYRITRRVIDFRNWSRKKKASFQQDNAFIRIAAAAEKWFDFGIELLSWPASSADLKPIENLWGIVARKVDDQEKPTIENIKLNWKNE